MSTNQNQKLSLEPTTNTHLLQANDIKSEKVDDSTIKLKIDGEGVVTHGEHGTLKTESGVVVKGIQQEYNPVTKMIQDCVD